MNKITFGWYRPASSAYLQIVIDHDKKTITRGYYQGYTDIKIASRQALNDLQNHYISIGYTLIYN